MNILSQVDNLYSGSRTGLELELRFGRFIRTEDGRLQFISSVPPQVFYRVLEYFRNHLGDLYLRHHDLITVRTREAGFPVDIAEGEPDRLQDIQYDGGIRESSVRIVDAPKFYMRKENVGNVNYQEYFLRFSKSKETEITPPSILGVQRYTRYKDRWSFVTAVDTGPLRFYIIDLTRVSSMDAGGKETVSFEIELEIYKPFKYAETDLMPGVLQMLKIIQGTSTKPLTESVVNGIIGGFNRTVGVSSGWRIADVVNRPVNLKLVALEEPSQYSITDKADGLRKLLYLRQDGGYLMYPETDVQLFLQSSVTVAGLSGTILDGEYICEGDCVSAPGVYLAFDILCNNGNDVTRLPFTQRLPLLEKVVAKKLRGVELKKYYIPNLNDSGKGGAVAKQQTDFYTLTNTALDSLAEKKYGNDGLIFNTLSAAYKEPQTVFKWKPAEQLTIDFLILQTDVPGMYTINTTTGDKPPVQFRGTSRYPTSGVIQTGEDIRVSNRQIVECRWDYTTRTFVPIRVRYDKLHSNSTTVANNVYLDIQNPITEATIRGRDLVMMRRYHNKLKRELIAANVSGTLLDIGSGNGGDIDKWVSTGLQQVYAVEPSLVNLQEFKRRLGDYGFVTEGDSEWKYKETVVNILNAGGEESARIRDFVGTQQPRCISIFNALTFFFSSESMLDALMHTLNATAQVGTHLIGMVMDGTLVQSHLAKKGEYSDYGWTIKALDVDPKRVYGNKVYINLDAAIVRDQTEYLTDPTVLTAKLAGIGFELVSQQPAVNLNLSQSQLKLSELYYTFVYIRKNKRSVENAVITSTIIPKTNVESEPSVIQIPNKDVVFTPIPDPVYLDDGETTELRIKGLKLERIGNVDYGDCILSAVLRSSMPKYANLTTSDARKRSLENVKAKFVDKFMEKNWEEFMGNDPFADKSKLQKCNRWDELPLSLNLAIGDFVQRDIIIIDDTKYISQNLREITYYTGGFDKCIILYVCRGLYDSVGYTSEIRETTFDSRKSDIVRVLTSQARTFSHERVKSEETK